MPEYLSPGVYVEEITGPEPIVGVSTSIVGFVGMAAQGPTSGLPVLVTSFNEYTRTFGTYLPDAYGPQLPNVPQVPQMNFLPYAVQGFFDNGGQLAYITRVVPGTDPPTMATSQNLKGGLITRLSRDVAAGSTKVQLSSMRGIQADTTPPPPAAAAGQPGAGGQPPAGAQPAAGGQPAGGQAGAGGQPTAAAGQPAPAGGQPASGGQAPAAAPLPGTVLTFVKNGITTSEQGIVASYDDSTKTVTLKAPLQYSYQARYTTVVTNRPDPTAGNPAVTISALNEGAWGNSLAIQVFQTSTGRAQVQAPRLAESNPTSGNYDTVILNSANTFYSGAIVEFNKGNTKIYSKVTKVAGTSIVVTPPFQNATDLDPDLAGFTTTASTCEFHLTVANNGFVEDYPTLTLDPATPYYLVNLINNQSSLISVAGQDNTSTDPFSMPSASDGLTVTMAGGADTSGPLQFDPRDFIGVDNGPGQRSGLYALEDIDEISIIAVPGIWDQDVQNAMIEQCERLKYRFAILDPWYRKATPLDDIVTQRQLYDTHYAALYFPNLVNIDPNPATPAGSTITLPPSGHMAGIYADTDDSRGVYKAPANVVIQGITDLDLTINKGEQDILNPSPVNINVLRNFRTQGRGLRVWGARCITSDVEWQYVNVRRLFIFVERSLDVGTQWVVFEPNAPPLWAQVTQSITSFLTGVWHDGALMGQKVEEAFFVHCDNTTMTQDDIDNGRLIVLVGIAPVKPAEFVIIRISQFTASASGQ